MNDRFLLAQLFLRSLHNKPTLESIKSTLKDFQKQGKGTNDDEKFQVLSQAYDRIMERIDEEKPSIRELTKKTLLWITYAKRSLSVFELQHAVAVEFGKSRLDNENIPHTQDMVSACAGLVTLDKETNIIQFAHYTMKEYFEQRQGLWFPNAHADMTKTCLTYLSFDVFETGYC